MFHKTVTIGLSSQTFPDVGWISTKITLLRSTQIFLLPARSSFYIQIYKVCGTLQDRNQRRPRATRTHCGRMG